jgi:predicted AAA+ superfamily ATPase
VGRTWPCFLKALASEGVAVLMEDFTFVAGEEDTRVLVEGLVVLKGDLTTVSTEVVVEKLSARLEGRRRGLRFNSRQTDGRQNHWRTRPVAPQCKGLWLPLTSLSWKGGDGKGNN